LNSFQRRELVGEEKEPYLPDIERAHFSENSPIDESVVTREEGMKPSQTVYVRGILSKKDGKFCVHSSGITTLTVSTRSIVEESVLIVVVIIRIGKAAYKRSYADSYWYWTYHWWVLSSSVVCMILSLFVAYNSSVVNHLLVATQSFYSQIPRIDTSISITVLHSMQT